MKTYIGLIILLFSGMCLQTQAQSVEYSFCSGQSATLDVTKYFPGTAFSWFKGNSLLNETSNKLKVDHLSVDIPIEEKYSCVLAAGGIKYDTAYFTVLFNPTTNVEILGSGLCEKQFATFSFTNSNEIESQTWTIDDTIISHRSTVDYLCGNKPVHVKLSVDNKFGCSTEVAEKTFNVAQDPQGEIDKMILITNTYFLNNVDCGNSIAEYEIVGLKGELSVTTWKFIIDNGLKPTDSTTINGVKVVYDKKYISGVELTENLIRVKWAKSVNSVGVNIQAYYSNGSCENMTSYKTILINDYSPGDGEIYQKPNGSNVLIFPSGKDIKGLNFQWGYTDPNGNEKTIADNNRYYCEFTAPNTLNTLNQYWVEAWFVSNDFCRTRSYLHQTVIESKVAESKGLHIYPNPVTDNLNVTLDHPVNGRLILSDLTGVLIISVPVTSHKSNITIDLSSLKRGNYILSYTDDPGNLITSGNIIVN